MARRMALTAAVLALGALSACGGHEAPKARATASQTPTQSPEQKFISSILSTTTIYQDDWADGSPTDDELGALAERWCSTAAAGHSATWMLNNGPDGLYPAGEHWGTVIDDAQTLIVLGVTAYCPEYREQIVSSLTQDGSY